MDKLSNEKKERRENTRRRGMKREREGARRELSQPKVTPILGKLWEKTLRRGTRASVENRL